MYNIWAFTSEQVEHKKYFTKTKIKIKIWTFTLHENIGTILNQSDYKDFFSEKKRNSLL